MKRENEKPPLRGLGKGVFRLIATMFYTTIHHLRCYRHRTADEHVTLYTSAMTPGRRTDDVVQGTRRQAGDDLHARAPTTGRQNTRRRSTDRCLMTLYMPPPAGSCQEFTCLDRHVLGGTGQVTVDVNS